MTLLRLPSAEPPLPHVLSPLPDESLLGYVFRLDAANSWEPGTVATMVCTHRTGWKRASAAMWASGTIFDLRRLAGLAEQPYEAITALTWLPEMRAATGDDHISVHALGDPRRIAFCPACLAETGTVPRRFLLPLVDACHEHRVRFLSFCSSHPALLPRVEAGGRVTCVDCGRDLGAAVGEAVVGAELELALDVWRAWSFLLGWRGDDIRGRGYRTIRSVTRNYPLRNLGEAVSLETLVRVFVALHIEPDLVARLEERPAKPCPNAACARFLPRGPRDPLERGRQVERHCAECGARFIGRRILLCFDPDHGERLPSAHSVRKAQRRLRGWKRALTDACREDVLAGRQITVTGTFRRAGVPLNANLRATRLGLVALAQDAARRQRLANGVEAQGFRAVSMPEYRLIAHAAIHADWERVAEVARRGRIDLDRPSRDVRVVNNAGAYVHAASGALDPLFGPRWASANREVAGRLEETLRVSCGDHGRSWVEPISAPWSERLHAAASGDNPGAIAGRYDRPRGWRELDRDGRRFVSGELSPPWTSDLVWMRSVPAEPFE